MVDFSYSLPGNLASDSERIFLQGYAPDDYISKLIATERSFYERDLLDHLALHAPRKGAYLDIGANIGNHTVHFAKFLADRVIAIEPNPSVIPVLWQNVRANNLTNVEVEVVGLGAHTGIYSLSLPHDASKNVGRMQLVPFESGSQGLVHIYPLDELILSTRIVCEGLSVSLIKIDVEGMQFEVIKGALCTIREHRPDLVVEAPTEDELQAVLNLLPPIGYQIVGRFCRTPTYHLSARLG